MKQQFHKLEEYSDRCLSAAMVDNAVFQGSLETCNISKPSQYDSLDGAAYAVKETARIKNAIQFAGT